MRLRYAAVFFVLATASLAGQEDPLPAVAPRPEPTVVLAVEPIRHDISSRTLADSARDNDYAAFHAQYVRSRDPRYAALDELWTYAMNDPLGAFYGDDVHDRLARAFPGYASYIEDFKIVDRNGNAFYPTSETRAFLIDHLGEAETTPVLRAATTRAPSRTTRAHRRILQKASVTLPKKRIAPVAKTPAPIVVASAPVVKPAPAQIAPPAPPVVQASAIASSVVRPLPDTNRATSRGILLLVLALLGIGLLAVIVRTPREEHEEKPDNVTSLNLTPPAAPDEKPRATGSHG